MRLRAVFISLPGLDPGIHVFILRYRVKDVDGRVKPGHGEK
jgi:hypothetical protein